MDIVKPSAHVTDRSFTDHPVKMGPGRPRRPVIDLLNVRLSQALLARLTTVTIEQLRRWTDDGKLTRDGHKRYYLAQALPTICKLLGAVNTEEAQAEADLALKQAKAARARLQVELLAGRSVDLHAVFAELERVGLELRRGLMALGPRLLPRLWEARHDRAAMTKVFEQDVEEHLLGLFEDWVERPEDVVERAGRR